MSHSSIVPMTVNGTRMYVYCAVGGVAGIAADDGRLLWETNEWVINTATVPSPVPIGDGRVFLAGGYNAGSIMLRVSGQEQAMSVKTLFRLPPETFGSGQQTPILYQQHLYGVIPDGRLACLDLQGNTVWTSGNTRRFGLGPYIIADGMIYVLNDTGTLTLVEATPAGYRQLAQATVLHDQDCWGPPALVSGRLIVRSLTEMVCLDVRQR